MRNSVVEAALTQSVSRLRVLGLPIDDVDVPGILEFMSLSKLSGKRARLFYVNAHVLELVQSDPSVRALFDEAELVFCDGFGAALAARALTGRKLSRQTPPDWIDQLAERAAASGWRVYLIGSEPGTVDQCADMFRARHPRLQIVGTHHGYFDKSAGSTENRAVVEAIASAAPDLLIVGFGTPLQERWLVENWDDLNVGNALAVGAMFDFLVGKVSRAPRWMTANGLEWLGRLVVEPKRLWRRYLIGLPVLMTRVLAARFFGSHEASAAGRQS